jgi:hypothetical protein
MARRLTLLFCVVFGSGIVAAQAPIATRSVIITIDNDLIAVRGRGAPPDYDYTHGAIYTHSYGSISLIMHAF